MAYSRLFIALNQGCADYARDVRGCVGRCILELRNDMGRLVLQVQGLKANEEYRVVLLAMDKYADVERQLYVDGSGKGEVRWNFQPKDIGISFHDISAVAVLVKDKAPLIGFTGDEYNWQRALVTEPKVLAAQVENSPEVISIIEEFSDNLQEIKNIVYSEKEDYIFNRENIKPFGEDNVKWIKGSLKEMAAIKNLWKYTNNPYVVQSCCEYKHLLLGKEKDSYWLGVPCLYKKEYTIEAKLQGFQYFKSVNGDKLEENKFCYCLLKC